MMISLSKEMLQISVKNIININIAMKKYIMLIIATILATSCDPYYYCYIANDSQNAVKIKIFPPIQDERLNWQPAIRFYSYDIIDLDTFGIYTIDPKSKVRFFGYLDYMPKEHHFPFSFLEVYSLDTLILTSKAAIIKQLIEVDKFEFIMTIND